MQADSTLVFRAVGDICPGDTSIPGLGVCTAMRRWGAAFPFANVAALLSGADIMVGNLEGVISERMESRPRPDMRFCGEPALAAELRRLGFTGLSVANNHVFEHGEACFMETVARLEDAGLEVFGLRDRSGEFYCKPVVVQVQGRKVGILAYNWISVEHFPAADHFIAQVHDGAVNYTWNRDPEVDRFRRRRLAACNAEVCADIRKLRSSVDHVVVIPHWGFEFVHVPPFGCVLEGRSFVEAGADLVVGIHPHVLQGYERHLHGAIFYSLGNFLFEHHSRAPHPRAVLTCALGGTAAGDVRFDMATQSASCEIALASTEEAAVMLGVVESSSRAIASPDSEQTLDDDRVYAAFVTRYRQNKLRSIATLLRLSMSHPFVALVILAKIRSLGHLIVRRLHGEKTRW
jgi:poly-gamma-glutamate synthesis protein (capsule biosynthesis protein)